MQCGFVFVVTLGCIVIHRELMPYRVMSDNIVATLSQWLICIWVGALFAQTIGALSTVPPFLVGSVLVFGTFSVIVFALVLALRDIKRGIDLIREDKLLAHADGIVSRMTMDLKYRKGDFIVYEKGGESFAVPRQRFISEYSLSNEPTKDAALARQGYSLFNSTIKVRTSLSRGNRHWKKTSLKNFLLLLAQTGSSSRIDQRRYFQNLSDRINGRQHRSHDRRARRRYGGTPVPLRKPVPHPLLQTEGL